MKRLLALPLAAAFLLPLIPSDASAHPAPYPHYHVKRRVVHHHHHHYVPPKRAVVVRRRVVVREPVVVQQPVVVKTRVVKKKQNPYHQVFGIGLRVPVSLLDGDKIGLSADENSPLAGAGLHLKLRVANHWKLELSADFMGANTSEVSQTSIPVYLSAIYNFLPKSRFQPYLLAGIGVHFTSLEYNGGQYRYEMYELGGQVGAGLEIFLTKWLALGVDVRLQGVFKNLDSQAKIRTDCLQTVGNMTGFCDNINNASTEDADNWGVQMMLGGTIYF